MGCKAGLRLLQRLATDVLRVVHFVTVDQKVNSGGCGLFVRWILESPWDHTVSMCHTVEVEFVIWITVSSIYS